MIRLKTYIVQKKESTYNIEKKAEKISLNYTIIRSEKDLVDVSDDMYLVLKDTFEVNDDLSALDSLNDYINKNNDFDTLYLHGEPEIWSETSKKVEDNILIAKVGKETSEGYIVKRRKIKNDNERTLMIFPPLVTNADVAAKKLLVHLKSWYAYKLGFPLSKFLMVALVLLCIFAVLNYNFEKKFASQVVFKSLE